MKNEIQKEYLKRTWKLSKTTRNNALQQKTNQKNKLLGSTPR